MQPQDALTQLTALRREGSCPRSQCSRSFLQQIRPLLDAGVIVEQRSGAGRHLLVRDLEALGKFIRSRFPNVPAAGKDLSRTAGVGAFRDSKAFASDTPEMVCVRAWFEGALLRLGQPAGAAAATNLHGVFSFLLTHAPDYSVSGRCALVENPALFIGFERLGLPIDLAIYGRGKVSARLLKWLASMTSPSFSLLHLPDYDPAGLAEHERLRANLGSRVRLHLPNNLRELFARFCNAGLLKRARSRAMLARLRRSDSPAVRGVVGLIEEHNAGLEQEALLLKLC